jgi:hypothetical protein
MSKVLINTESFVCCGLALLFLVPRLIEEKHNKYFCVSVRDNKTNRSMRCGNGQEIVGNLLEGVLYTSYISATTLSRV